VRSVETSNAGEITVTTTASADLKDAGGKTVVLTPMKTTTTAMAVGDAPAQVFAFTCKAGTMPGKYLPGSCK
jgi:hypothetical protein